MKTLSVADRRRLLDAAAVVSKNAYAPYSHFQVGAALLAVDGRIYTGANVENVSFGATLCAERAALSAAVTEGARQFSALAICAGDCPTSPCGLCRQMLAEFGDLVVLYADSALTTVRETTLSALLPEAFTDFKADRS